MKSTREKDKKVVKVVKEMKKAKVKMLRGNKQEIEENLVLTEEKVYVPKDEELRLEVIQSYHDVPVAKTGGRQKTIELVIRNYQ